MKFIIGEKVGMTQIFDEEGKVIPTTVVKSYPLTIIEIKTKEHSGYDAIQVGYVEIKPTKLNRPERSYFEKKKLSCFKYLKEFPVENIDNLKVGDNVYCDVFKKGEYIDVIGESKGKGFSGVMKRHNFSGGPASHGSMIYRKTMSIGSTDAARVVKGKKMPGQYGAERVTIQNLKIVKIDKENNLVMIGGAVPGPNKGKVVIRKAVKKRRE